MEIEVIAQTQKRVLDCETYKSSMGPRPTRSRAGKRKLVLVIWSVLTGKHGA